MFNQNPSNPSNEDIQSEYKEKIDKLFMDLKNDNRIMVILENFFPRIPKLVFMNSEYYSLFEYLVSKNNLEIGRKLLWSSSEELNNVIKIYEEERIQISRIKKQTNDLANIESEIINLDNFVNNDFAKLIKLIKSMVTFENEFDYPFVILRFIQLAAPSFIRIALEHNTGIEFGDIESFSLEDCLYTYYSKYENVFSDPWISFFTYLLLFHEKFGEVENIEYYNYLQRRLELIQLLNDNKQDFEYKIFETDMMKRNQNIEAGFSIHDIDLMGGADFEKFVAKVFSKMGYLTTITKHTGDFGVDVLAEKDGIKIGIQAKCYSGVVNNSAIQEIAAGVKYYKCEKGIVVTNSTYSKSAIDLAKSNNIQLWDRKILIEKIIELFSVSNE